MLQFLNNQVNTPLPMDTKAMEPDHDRLTDPKPAKKAASGGLKPRDALLAAGVLLIIGGIAWFIVQDKEQPVQPPMIGEKEVPAAALERAHDLLNQPQAPEPQLTDSELAPVQAPQSIDASDSQVELALADMSPPLLAWFTPQEQVRKWVSLTVNLADGNLVSKHRPVNYPMDSFKVDKEGERYAMSSANFERATRLVDAFTAIPPEKLAAYYRQWTPVLESAFTELGVEGSFHGHFDRVLNRALAVPTLSKPPALEQPHVLYVYEDEELEDAPDIDKLMWRLGPDKMVQLQVYLQEFKNSL